MNCKQGDLAIVIRSKYGNEGKIVRCVSYFDGPWLDAPSGTPGWVTDTMLPRDRGEAFPHAFDSILRPIRDSDGEDETFEWAGKPSQIDSPVEAR